MARLRNRPEQGAASIPQRVHLVGAGGMHMSAIGTILLARGHLVTGSDLVESEHTRRLQEAGATIYHGHAAANVGRAELVVATVAAQGDNPELRAARERGVPVIVRAEMVQRLVAGHELLAVAGTHGKTTTTTLLALMALRGGLDPLVLAGGDSPELGGNARDGGGRIAVVEADEYAEAFLQYEPRLALVTNIEADHLDYYGSEERLRAAFAAFAARVEPDGTLFVCADSPAAAALGEARRTAGARVERYGLDAEADWRAAQVRGNDRGGLECIVQLHGAELGRLSLRIPGRHNIANALGALAVAMRAGVDFHRAVQAAEEFGGVHRRFELLGEAAGVTVVDDYAHHPTEVRATLQAARARFPGRRLVGCFQPHTYSRTRYLAEGFRTCFEGLDALYVTGTYAAREQADAGSDGRTLAAEVTRPAPRYIETLDEALEVAARELHAGDVFLTLGAGDIERLGPLVLARLEAAP
jgi:UDP-N-acetylmuramate--alanine ligase